MNMFKRLWQRIFVYTIIIVIFSVGMGLYLHLPFLEKRMRHMALEMTGELERQLKTSSLESARVVLNIFNQRPENFLWLEDGQGNVLAGRRIGGAAGHAWKERYTHGGEEGGMSIWVQKESPTRYIVETPMVFEGRPATFYTAFSGPKSPPFEPLLIQGLATTFIPAILLSLWMARSVSRPLRRLQKEISELKEPGAGLRVTVAGNDEIADVARAINLMSERLQHYIGGMRKLLVAVSHEVRSPLARMALSVALIEDGLLASAALREKQGEPALSGETPSPASGPTGGLAAAAPETGPDGTAWNGLERRKKRAEHFAGAEAASGLAAHSNRQWENRLSLGFKHLDALQTELEHMDKLIGTILQSNRLELQDKSGLTELVSFSLACEDSAARFQETFNRAGLVFEHAIEPDLFLLGDGTLLLQLLSNLLDNAAKYANGPEGIVSMQLSRRRNHAFLTVENSYDPMDATTLENIFEPFFRAAQSSESGIGLGLSLVRNIAQLHGGDAMAVSTERGVCLCVQLPLAAEDEPLAVSVSPA